MRILPAVGRILKFFGLSPVYSSLSGFYGAIREANTGDWQRGIISESKENLLRNSAVYACITGISSDIAKMRIKLSRNDNGIWTEITENEPRLKLLRNPNHYQNRIQFIETWMISKLLFGNAYIAIERDNRNVVNALYCLHPLRVSPMVTPDGSVYYSVGQDPLSHLTESTAVVPASEIIHDRSACLFHPLIGVPPLWACALSGGLGNKIQEHSIRFFMNRAVPGGMLTAPGTINETTAKRLKEEFEKNYSGENMGRLLVLGDNLKYELIQMTAQHAQLAEQLKLSVEDIARAFHYPLFKLGGPVPTLQGSLGALITTYYTDCLQIHIEQMELCLDNGLQLAPDRGTEFDLDNLLRMDTESLFKSNSEAIGGGWMKPNEARFRANYAPVIGGNSPMLQQQNYSLEALAKRDAKPDPFEKPQQGFANLEPQKTKMFGKEDFKAIMSTRLRKLTKVA